MSGSSRASARGRSSVPVLPADHVSPVEEGFGGPEVCRLVGITYRQLDHWARTGFIRPSIADARGSGTKRRYSYRDVIELKVVKSLLDAGVSLRSARRAVQCLRDDLGADLASARLVLAGSNSLLAHSDGEVVDLLRGGQGVLNIVALGGVIDELEADIRTIDRGVASRDAGGRPSHARAKAASGAERTSRSLPAQARARARGRAVGE
jgi:DNA-binding transcriptional MerR regulator